MMNLNLNLLPPIKKQRLDYVTNFLFLRGILHMIIITGSILATATIWSWVVLQENFNNLAESAALLSKEHSAYNKDIKQINTIVDEINDASKGFVPISPYITEFIRKMPGNIKLNNLSFDRQNQSFTISGVAMKRDDFLNFQETLKEIAWLQDINAPTSQLFQKENIGFELKAKLKAVQSSHITPKPKTAKPVEDDLL